MDYRGLVKRLNPPAGWTAPSNLSYEDIRATAISRDHRTPGGPALIQP
jgi:hypothetical protein